MLQRKSIITRNNRPACCAFRTRCFAALVMLLACAGPSLAAWQTKRVGQSSVASGLSPTAEAVRTLIREKRLEDLRWPDFSDFARQAAEFYQASNYSLAWIEESHFKPRAREMIQVLSDAQAEGLNPDDYDGPRWEERIAQLQTDHSAQIEARFDVALT